MGHLDDMKARRTASSNLVACTMCPTADLHLMRYRVFKCASPSCNSAEVDILQCQWACKTLTCQAQNIVSLYVKGDHLVDGDDPPTGKLTKRHKGIARELCLHGVTPFRIRNAIAATTTEAEIPALGKVQNFVAHFRKTEMNNTDDIEVSIKLIADMAFNGEESEPKAFSFSSNIDEYGVPVVGDGSDEDPFIVGFSTKRLLRRLDRLPSSFVLHIDATYKLSQLEYPVVVCGLSDNARAFHLVAMFITSQEQERHYTAILTSLKVIYTKVVRKPMRLRYVLGDACQAQFNAVDDVLDGSQLDVLMCFYHVMANVNKRLNKHFKSLSPIKKAQFIADIYDMHYAATEARFHALMIASEIRWEKDEDIAALGSYFRTEWLTGSFTKWQCFRTPTGYATTNNPAEQFNNKIKTSYGIRSRLKMGMLIGKLAHICNTESTAPIEFRHEPEASSHLTTRANELRRTNDLYAASTASNTCDHTAGDYIVVKSQAVSAVYVKPRKQKHEAIEVAAQVGTNAARMERDEQPDAGWAVNVRTRACPCKYYFKYGKCIHLLHALYIRHGTFTPAKGAFVNRRTRNKKRTLESQIAEAVATQTARRGRPILSGPALSFE